MQSTQVMVSQTTASNVHTAPISLPDHTQLPESDGTFVKNFQELPQSIVLTSSIEPVLQKLHPNGRYCIGQDSGIYWTLTEPPEKGAEAPDWFYVPDVSPLVNGEYRRSYVMWKEIIAPLIAIEFVSGNGSEERDVTPPPENNDEIDPKTGKKKKAGKFWVYERAICIPFYAIYEVRKAAVEVHHLVDGRYQKLPPNERGHYPINAMGVELGILFGTEETPVPWLRWWDADGNLLLTGDERAQVADKRVQVADERAQVSEAIANQERLAKQIAEQEKQIAEAIAIQERQSKEKLAAYLRSIGINPDELP
jgi:Uma2 family endonuclease